MGPEYKGKIHPNSDYFHGQIPYVKGAHLYQVSRANREDPAADDGTGHTYKHAPDLCWYKGNYYIQYLTNPKDEHGGAGVSVLASSPDGTAWGNYRISFPEYRIPPCEVTDYKGQHHVFDGSTPAFMHQRMAFYQAANGVMLVLGFYGWSPQLWMTNWDNYGVGRVVRRLYPDGSLGDIYFIRVNWQAGWKKEHLNYPLFEESGDEKLKEACRELLGNPLAVQQWAEENGDRDPMIRVKHPRSGTYQAFCWYHRTEQEVVGLWKHSFVSESHDGGESWEEPRKSPSLVMSGQKIWGCRTGDGRFALVYDPTLETQHRFPLCIVTSDDGLHFDDMRLVHGEVPPIRYEGFCKDLGPQYMRGISEGNPRPDGELCLTYSVNKEDIWFARIPLPVTGGSSAGEKEMPARRQSGETEESCAGEKRNAGPSRETAAAGAGAVSGVRNGEEAAAGEPLLRDTFFDGDVLREWNLYQPSWCRIACGSGGELRIEDEEPYDYARLVRVLPASRTIRLELRLRIGRLGGGKSFQIELCNEKHQTAVRLIFRPAGRLRHRTVCELDLGRWEEGQETTLRIDADCRTFSYTAEINGKAVTDGSGRKAQFCFMAAVNEIAELSLRTGEARYLSNLEQNPDHLPREPLTAGRLAEGAEITVLEAEVEAEAEVGAEVGAEGEAGIEADAETEGKQKN